MKKLDYLKLALNNNFCKYKRWIITAFSVTKPKSSETTNYFGEIIVEPWGMSFINDKDEREKIDDSKSNEPLFSFKDRVTVDETWAPNIKGTIETSIGNLIFNQLCIVPCFGDKLEFQLGKISISKIEDIIAKKLTDTPMDENGYIDTEQQRSKDYYYVDEYLKFCDSLQFLSGLSQLCTWAATPKNITPPTGIEEFKKALLIKYDGKLKDPIQLASFEKELLDFDSQYLKGDPSIEFLSKKIRETARKKLFLTIGAEEGFDDNITLTPVVNSLNEGWPKDPEEFTAMMNNLRKGSFSRGAETVKGGISAKVLLRGANNYKIVDNDCGTSLGIRRIYKAEDIDKLVGRNILINGKTLYIKDIEQANNYVGKSLIVRSPMYCKSEGETICVFCTGKALSQYRTGLTIPLTKISAIILATSMAKMHSSTLSVTKLNISEAFS